MKQLIKLGALASCLTMTSLAADWPVWLGPDANGLSAESVKPSGDVAWTAELGLGYSAVSVMNGQLYTAGNVEGEDVIYCLNPETGEEIWTYKYASDKGGSFFGPMATPVTDGKSVWMFNRHGEIFCLDAATGKKLWGNTLVSESAKLPTWMTASSVLLYKDLAIVAMGDTGAAVNKNTGELVWASDGMASYSTPSILTYQGKDYLLVMSGTTMSVVDPLTGQVFAQSAYAQDCGVTGCSPVIIDAEKGLFYITSGYGSGRSVLYSFDGSTLKEEWSVKELKSQFSTPIYKDGVIYGSHGNTNARKALTAMDAKTGEVLWTGAQRFGSPLIAGDTIIYLDERGELSFLKLDKTKEELIASHRVIKGGKCWQMPVLANGYIYCRDNEGSFVAVKVK